MVTKEISASYHKTQNILRKSKLVEMDISMTMWDPVKQVKGTDVVIMAILKMTQSTICLTTVEVSLHAHLRDQVFLTRRMRLQWPYKPSCTIDVSAVKMVMPAEWHPWPRNHSKLHVWMVSYEVRLQSPQID